MFNQSNDKLQVICSASENDKRKGKENDLSSPKFVGVTSSYTYVEAYVKTGIHECKPNECMQFTQCTNYMRNI